MEKPEAATITPKEAAANKHCPNLKISPVLVPGLPINSFIYPLSPLPNQITTTNPNFLQIQHAHQNPFHICALPTFSIISVSQPHKLKGALKPQQLRQRRVWNKKESFLHRIEDLQRGSEIDQKRFWSNVYRSCCLAPKPSPLQVSYVSASEKLEFHHFVLHYCVRFHCVFFFFFLF